MVRTIRPRSLIAAALALAATPALAGPDKVAYPADKGVLYGVVDRADNKQVRELYAPQAVVDAVRAGKPIPTKAPLTMHLYKAKVDDKGEPVKDAKGRFQKGDAIAHFVMEKGAGWGTGYGADMRNGEWEYRAFAPDGKVNEKADLKPCFTCHLKMKDQDFVFSVPQMKSASK
ncbi:MAG: cytochrome P460 family protein [Betaproteobacteria bacterium]|nr:cytochrome P460 family protein [Betaproteobacteria bacterium]